LRINDLQNFSAPRGTPGRRGAAIGALVWALVGVALPAAIGAQPVLGGGEDATVLRKGRARIRLGGVFESAAERFDADGNRLPLGSSASFDTLGARLLPALGPLQDTLRLMTGSPALGTSLGQLRTDLRVDVQTIPLVAEYGVFDRLTLSILVPVVRTRSSVNPTVNATGTEGNLGFNPARVSGSTAVLARNNALSTELGVASDSLRALVTRCGAPTPTDPRCTSFPAARAQALLVEAAAFRRRVGYVYGTGASEPGQRFVPIAGTPAQRAVDARVDSLSRAFAAFQIASLRATSTPQAATQRLGIGGLQTILADEDFGVAGDSLRGIVQSGTGDIDLAATFQWLDTFRGDERARLAPSGFQARSSITAGYRLGTGSGDFPFTWYDVPTGTGASALLLRSTTDLVFGRRAWATVAVRAIQPFAVQQELRVPAYAGQVLVPRYRQVTVDRTFGRELQFELTPRYNLSDAFSVLAQYQLRTRAADRNRGQFEIEFADGGPSELVDASVLDVDTEAREQRAGLGVAYSTLAAYARGRSTLPIEVSWLYRQTVAGSGAAVLRATSQQVQVRVYLRILGERTRGIAGVR
jgi:hypothetical protein